MNRSGLDGLFFGLRPVKIFLIGQFNHKLYPSGVAVLEAFHLPLLSEFFAQRPPPGPCLHGSSISVLPFFPLKELFFFEPYLAFPVDFPMTGGLPSTTLFASFSAQLRFLLPLVTFDPPVQSLESLVLLRLLFFFS